MTIDWKALSQPFAPGDLSWRVGSTTKDKKRCTLLVYIDARNVMDRLDEVCGPENWQATYAPDPRGKGGIICRIGIRAAGEWVWKEDGAGDSDIEAVKGGFSDSFKRAAVRWGIGRYLYAIESSWHPIEEGWANGRGIDISTKEGHVGWAKVPTLPKWAMPGTTEKPPSAPPKEPERDDSKKPKETDDEKAARQAKHHKTWPAAQGAFMAKLGEEIPELKNPYEAVAAWCESMGKPRPTGMDDEQRKNLLGFLASGRGNEMFWDWWALNQGAHPVKASADGKAA